MNEEKIVYSLAWFQPKEWHQLKAVVDDPSTLDDTYEEWRKNAENVIQEFRKNGKTVKKISIKTDELIAWCKSKYIKPDGKARSEYAALLMQKRNS